MNHKKTLKMKRIVSGMLALTLLFGGAVLPNDVMSNVASVITAQAATMREISILLMKQQECLRSKVLLTGWK
jgi:hypothetical protein